MLAEVNNKKLLPTVLGGEYELIPKKKSSGTRKRGVLEKWTYRRGRRNLAVFRFPAGYRECFSVADFVLDWDVRRR